MSRINEAMDFESDTTNWKYPFKTMTKKYGREFIETLKVMWSVNDGVQSENEFCEMNGIPQSFFTNTIKP